MARRTQGEGSAYMRKDGRAAASIMYEGKRITKYGKTKTEARQNLDAFLADLRAGKVVIGPKQTVKQYLEHWLENVHPKKQKHKPHVLTPDECKRLVAAARGRRLWFLLLVALTTGARLGELCALHWEDIDLTNLRIHIHRNCARAKGRSLFEKSVKTASGVRKVVLSQAVLDGMKEQRAYIAGLRLRSGSHWRDLDLVFPNKDGSYLNPDRVRKELFAILVEAGIDRRKFHDLRHSAATLLFAAGLNPKVVSEALGHSNISTTLSLYGDVTPDMQQGVADVMDRLFE